MKASIEVRSRDEAEYLRTALADPFCRAFAVVMGALLPLPVGERQRVLALAGERLLAEEKADEESA